MCDVIFSCSPTVARVFLDHPLTGSPYENMSEERFPAKFDYKYKMINGVVRVFKDSNDVQR